MEEEQKKSGRGKIIATAVAILLLIAAALAALWLLRDKKKDITFVAPAGLLEARNGAVYVADQGQNNIIRIDGDKRTLVAGYTLPADTHGKAAGGHRDGAWDEALFNRPFALVENGSWAPMSAKLMAAKIGELKICTVLDAKVTVRGRLTATQDAELEACAAAVAASM